MTKCVHCSQPIAEGAHICPSCRIEQPVSWMVSLAYLLTFLFVQGAVFRLIWPNAQSLLKYGVYFAATSLAAVLLRMGLNRYRKARAMPAADDHEDISD